MSDPCVGISSNVLLTFCLCVFSWWKHSCPQLSPVSQVLWPDDWSLHEDFCAAVHPRKQSHNIKMRLWKMYPMKIILNSFREDCSILFVRSHLLLHLKGLTCFRSSLLRVSCNLSMFSPRRPASDCSSSCWHTWKCLFYCLKLFSLSRATVVATQLPRKMENNSSDCWLLSSTERHNVKVSYCS